MTADTPPVSLSSRPAGMLPPWMPLVVVAAAWAAHGGVLANGWVWDDAIVIRDDPSLSRGLGAIPGMLVSPWGGAQHDVGLYRPLVSISLAIQAAISGTVDAFPFHLVNLILHASVATALLAVLLRVFPRRPVLVSASALAFAVHPVHAGTVSWIVARGDLMAALFLLLAVLVWTRERETSLSAALVTGLLWFLALLSKEAAAVFPPVLLCLDAAIRRVRAREALATRSLPYASLVVPFAAWLVLRITAVGWLDATGANAVLGGRNAIERLSIGAGALVRTAAKLFLPSGLCGDGSADPVLSARTPISIAYVGAACLLIVSFLAVVVAVMRRRAGPVSLAVGLFVVLSIPVLQLIPIGAVFEDRFAYLPSLALLVIVGLLAETLVAHVRLRLAAVVVLGAALAGLALASWRTAANWYDEETFNRALIAADPGHVRAIDRLSRELMVRASRASDRAAASPARSDEERATVKRLQALAGAGTSEAVALLERARSLPSGRRDASVLWGLGDAYLALPVPRFTDALGVYRELLEVKRVQVGARRVPVDRVVERTAVALRDRRALSRIYHNVARAHLGLAQNTEAAVAHEVSALWCPPGDPFEYTFLRAAGVAIWRTLGEPRRALPFLDRAALLAPRVEREAAAKDAAEARSATGRTDDVFRKATAILAHPSGVSGPAEAQPLFEEVIGLDPDFAAAHVGVAEIKRWKGDFRGALAALDAADEALDRRRSAVGSETDAALRERIATARARYARERDEPDK